MEPISQTIQETDSLMAAANRLEEAPHGQLPVTDRAGRYQGIVTARAVADALADGLHDNSPVSTVVELPAAVGSHSTLDSALDELEASRSAIPVLSPDGSSVVGWLTHQRVLAALRPPPTPPPK